MDITVDQGLRVNGAGDARTWELQRLARTIPMRGAVRFPMDLAVRVQTAWGEVMARTVDVSANGVLFSGDQLPEVGSRIEFKMTMPGAVMGHLGDLVVHCSGRIVRHEARSTGDVAAAVIDEYVLTA